MPELDLVRVFTHRLNKAGVNYFVTGAVASIVYGEPRLTHDIDLVVELSMNDAARIVEAFPIEEFYCPPVEVIQIEIGRQSHGHFNLIHHETGFKGDIYAMGRDELHRWAMSNRRRLELEGEPVWLAPAEYVILRKLQYYHEGKSQKHLRDIASMIVISREDIDFEALLKRIEHHRLFEEWTLAKRISEA